MAYGNFSASTGVLILLSGMPGTGKTTFARALADVLDFEHVESDAVRRALAPHPTYNHWESGAVFAQVEAAATRTLKAGRHALIDATNLTVRDRKRFVMLSRELGVRLIPVRVVAPESVVRERLLGPRKGHSQATFEVYTKMKGRAEGFSIPVMVVDTQFDLDPAIELVRSLVEAGHRG